MTANKSKVIEEQITELKNADSIGETPFGKLFHEARTTSRRHYTGVSLQVRVRDGEFEAHGEPIKTQQGEHLRGTDAWDNIIGLPVRPFMDTKTARQMIVQQLRAYQQTEIQREEHDNRVEQWE